MKKRGIRFYCYYCFDCYILDFPANCLLYTGLWKCPFETKYGIRILDPWLDTRTQFTSITTEALNLIATTQPVSFKRVQQYIRTICNSAGVVGSTYAVTPKTCTVNLRAINSIGNHESATRFLASILVYDATFGYLLSQGVLRLRRNRIRFDHVRRRAAQRFVRRLGMSETPWDKKNMIDLGMMEMTAVWLVDTVRSVRESSKDS